MTTNSKILYDLIQILSSIGEHTESWGTPQDSSYDAELAFLKEILYYLCDRQDPKQCKVMPETL